MDDTEIERLIENAEGESVTRNSLTDSGRLSGLLFSATYESVLSYLDDGEQPHHIKAPNYGGLPFGSSGGLAEGKKQRHVFTDRRVLFLSTEYTFSVTYDEITDVTADPGANRLGIETTDREQPYELKVGNPEELADFVQRQLVGGDPEGPVERVEQLSELRQRDLLSQAEYRERVEAAVDELVAANTTVSRRIEQLETIHDAGYISDEEFERRKSQIVGGL